MIRAIKLSNQLKEIVAKEKELLVYVLGWMRKKTKWENKDNPHIYREVKEVIRMVKEMAFNLAEMREGLVAQKLLEVVKFWAPSSFFFFPRNLGPDITVSN